jgi:predicted nucleotidyltransferase
MAGPRETLRELAAEIQRALGPELVGLYLFGSLAVGTFREGKSDLDLFAVVGNPIAEGELLDSLRRLHAEFVAHRPGWVERIEVLYVDRSVLQSFPRVAKGRLVRISPGEPIHVTDADSARTIEWHGVCAAGETLVGPPPTELAPAPDAAAFRAAVLAQVRGWPAVLREPWIPYVPSSRAYAVVTLCRALHALAEGEQASKEAAAAWSAERYPEWADYIERCVATLRADTRPEHEAVIAFGDHAVAEAEKLARPD